MEFHKTSSTILPLGRYNGPPSPSYMFKADSSFCAGEGLAARKIQRFAQKHKNESYKRIKTNNFPKTIVKYRILW